jgi:hypothetical protein
MSSKPKSHRLQIVLSQEEFEKLSRVAEMVGISRGAVIRQSLRMAIGPVARIKFVDESGTEFVK